MTLTFWILFLVAAAAVAIATVLRKKPAARISDAERARQLPRRDELAGLGLSAVRPATARPAEARPTEARPVQAEPAAVEAPAVAVEAPAVAVEAPAVDVPAVVAPPTRTDAWIDDVLDDVLEDEADGETPPDVAPAASAAPAAEPETERAGSDETVWTFDADAAPRSATSAAPSVYVRPEQTLWDAPEAVALLAASLAARLGGSVAVVQGLPDAYRVELLAGPAAAHAPALLPTENHPLQHVPTDGVLSLLADGAAAALTYHADPEAAVGQALAQSLGASSVFVVSDLPPGAPEVDDATAAIVERYTALLTSLTDLPAAPGAAAEAVEAWDDALVESQAVDIPRDLDLPDLDLDADLAEDADTGIDPAEDEALGETVAPPVHIARPGARRSEPPPPPRAVILNAEIDAARRDRRLLVFALVTLADAETVLRGGADDMVRAEAALRQRLTAAPAVRRVEPFGDLVFGAFLDAEGPEVVAWAERVSQNGPPLLVGAAPASGTADAVRAAATDALQRAYETDAICVV